VSPNTSNAVLNWANGHYYAYTSSSLNWYDAKRESENAILNDIYGYLATSTSYAESDFIAGYSNGYSKIATGAYLGATDEEGTGGGYPYTTEGVWYWKAPGSAENAQLLRSNGTNYAYTNWNSNEPNNSGNEDFLMIWPDRYWNDAKNNSPGGYITEWGKSGVEFNASFSNLNGYEDGTAPKMTISLDRFVPDHYVDIRNGTPLVDIPITFGGTAVAGSDYSLSVSGGNSYYSGGRLYVKNTNQVTLTFNPISNSSWQAPRGITASMQGDGSENIYGINGAASSQVWLFDDEPSLSLGQGAYQFIRTLYTSSTNYTLPADNSGFNTNADVLIFDSNGIN